MPKPAEQHEVVAVGPVVQGVAAVVVRVLSASILSGRVGAAPTRGAPDKGREPAPTVVSTGACGGNGRLLAQGAGRATGKALVPFPDSGGVLSVRRPTLTP